MICDRYDIVVVPFPFHEIPIRKRRPVVVLSNEAFNRDNGWTILAMVTTAKATRWASDTPILAWQMAGLNVECVIRLRLQTMPNDIIDRKLGRLADRDRTALDKHLASTLI
ncbi:MAG: type II toxin-antitoxin system PemK/MazF family toxin [Mesorhizobium sp.]